MDLPKWLPRWCRDHLGSAPDQLLYTTEHMSAVFGLRLDDGRQVVVKSRPDQQGREATGVEVQRFVAAQGFPCPAPLTGVTVHDGRAIHAEQWRPGGEVLRGDDPATARLFAELLAELITLAEDIEVGGTAPGAVAPPLPNPEWVRWDHDDPPGPWPRVPFFERLTPGRRLPPGIEDAAHRVRDRMLMSRLPRVLGHADWESQNLRWRGTTPWAVHDWDSVAWISEAGLAGSASGAFASWGQPRLAPLESSATFLQSYQDARGRRFSDEEMEVSWAASLWVALHNARAETLMGKPPLATRDIFTQGPARLRLAGA